jgi:hypothetical protein
MIQTRIFKFREGKCRGLVFRDRMTNDPKRKCRNSKKEKCRRWTQAERK